MPLKNTLKYGIITEIDFRGEFMHRYFGDTVAYGLFNTLSVVIPLILSLFCFKSKKESISLYSECAIRALSRIELKIGKFALNIGKILKLLLVSLESLIMVYIATISSSNREFGNLVGTGANYFALLFTTWLFVILASILILSNPIKQLDFTTQILPIHICVVRLACFFNGCCWGIPWEHGPYNYHPSHPGNQVPVQAIESGFAFAIFLFFLWYRKKAKPGTMFPMYMILYSSARFFNEFFTADYPAVLGPFKVYHILCVNSVVVGLVLFFLMRKYGEKLSDLFESLQDRLEELLAKHNENRKIKIEEEKAKEEADKLERREKAKAARAKASVKYRKK